MFTKEELKQELLRDKKFHYEMTGKDVEILHYEIRNDNKEGAEAELKELIFFMDLWKDNEVPEWYTREDLKKDIERVKAM